MIKFYYKDNNIIELIGIECINCNKLVGYKLKNINLNKFITVFLGLFCFRMLVSSGLFNQGTYSSLILNSSVILGFRISLGIIKHFFNI